jgi:hypothetical protein
MEAPHFRFVDCLEVPSCLPDPLNTFASIKIRKIRQNHLKKLDKEFDKLTVAKSEVAECKI